MLVKEFVPYKQALALKELGFDEHCFKMSEHKKVCDEQSKPQGCQLHNLHCGYPDCTIDKSITPVPLPTFSQAFRWFREKHNLRGFIGFRPNVKKFDYHIYDMSLSGMEYVKQRTMEEFNKDPKVGTYEEAELGCLLKLIEIVKNK